MAFLTKSRFKVALECPTKLYYASNKPLYNDENEENLFLESLAEGGYQVGELAKYLFCDDPIGNDITLRELDYQVALNKTSEIRKKNGRTVIAEAAFNHKDFFVRTDIFVEEKDRIDLYEVKSKSWDESVEFLKTGKRGANKGKQYLDKDWSNYLYDIAFQKYVVEKSNPGKKVKAHIILADKTKESSIDGLNQFFKIGKDENGRISISVKEGISRKDLGDIPLKVINVDTECTWIYENPVEIDLEGNWQFEDLITFLAEKYNTNERIWTSCVGTKCKDCQFVNPDYPAGLRSGFHECWKHIAGLSDKDFTKPLILELWGGGSGAISHVTNAIEQKILLMEQANETLYTSPNRKEFPVGTMDATERRTIQLNKTKNQDFEPHLEMDGLKELFSNLETPYHFIDFETTAVALPFHEKRKPYEAVAFQYSYHLMDEKGNIKHQNQYLSFDRGLFPNYDFLRHLRNDLMGKPGTIFRYHHHENNYLNHIYKQLFQETKITVPDKEELMEFIREIAHPTSNNPDRWEPSNDMQDLHKFVLQYFYSLHAKGSNSLKDILPAVIKSSDYLQKKYSQPIYGGTSIPSLNFTIPHIWLPKDSELNPYKTLPVLFDDFDKIRFDINDDTLTELAEGGAAMMAYAYLQFTDMPEEQRQIYRDALLRYCELDTMAMVMVWEYWGKEIGVW